MSKLTVLYTGEVVRMRRYGITGASLAAALLWVLVLHFSSQSVVSSVFPLVLFVDTTLMSLLLAGVTMIFERQEHALKSMLVLPVSKDAYLLAKSLAVTTSSLTTLILLLIYGIAAKGLQVNILGLVGVVALEAFVFAQIGLVMTYYSKDFTDLLMGMFKFSFLLAIPTILEFAQLLNVGWVKTLQYINPTKSAMVLLQATVSPSALKDVIFALAYLLALGVALYLLSRRLFDDYAARGGGV